MIPRTEITPDPIPQKTSTLLFNKAMIHLPDATAAMTAAWFLILPHYFLSFHYQDTAKYIEEAQTIIYPLKVALASNIPTLAFISSIVAIRLNKNNR